MPHPSAAPAIRTATPEDLPQLLALLADDDHPPAPADVSVTATHRAAFDAIDADPRNELLVLDRGDGTVLGFLQATYIPGLGNAARDRALLEAVRIHPHHRGDGLGGHLVRHAIDRARTRGCTLVQLTSNKNRGDAHRFYENLGFTRSHDGFKLRL
ncbi:GNAT family N-acetyltransferase [Yinghuangia soli]|uniref:GNAT family N-acetyltransferase n=1 Tax=Yinghuangia soli TaxID=2908204 RepID=A0AA41Q4H4_9ACTN|nr:GNAT family N-acetyltransferase [Yinghuangia soli]MCF2530825.1 GNAT family N-acetyltransferase [Yinghuangia soli]